MSAYAVQFRSYLFFVCYFFKKCLKIIIRMYLGKYEYTYWHHFSIWNSFSYFYWDWLSPLLPAPIQYSCQKLFDPQENGGILGSDSFLQNLILWELSFSFVRWASPGKGDKIWNVRRYTLYHFWRWWPQWDQRRFEVVFDILIYIPNFLKKYFPLNSFPFIFWNQDIKWGN